jgi:hypothetical protein
MDADQWRYNVRRCHIFICSLTRSTCFGQAKSIYSCRENDSYRRCFWMWKVYHNRTFGAILQANIWQYLDRWSTHRNPQFIVPLITDILPSSGPCSIFHEYIQERVLRVA